MAQGFSKCQRNIRLHQFNKNITRVVNQLTYFLKNYESRLRQTLLNLVQNLDYLNEERSFYYERVILELEGQLQQKQKKRQGYEGQNYDRQYQRRIQALSNKQKQMMQSIKTYEQWIQKLRKEFSALKNNIQKQKDLRYSSDNMQKEQLQKKRIIKGHMDGQRKSNKKKLSIESVYELNLKINKNRTLSLCSNNIEIILQNKTQKKKKNSTLKSIQNLKTAEDYIQRFNLFFMGEVLDDQEVYKEYSTQKIQYITNKQIVKTKLLYRFDPRIKQNIHMFIDDKPNIMLLCKTKNEYIIGCYSEAPFSKTRQVKPGSLSYIFSFTNQKYFPILSDKKAISYDNHYVIFGNSQIRVNGTQNKLFSNFGISNAYFDNREESIHTLFGQGDQKQILYQSLQIFQIVFG